MHFQLQEDRFQKRKISNRAGENEEGKIKKRKRRPSSLCDLPGRDRDPARKLKMLEKNIRIFVECVRDEVHKAQNGIWVKNTLVYGRFYSRRFPSNEGQNATEEMKTILSAACVQALKGGQVKCGNKYNEKIKECDYSELSSGLGVYLSLQSSALHWDPARKLKMLEKNISIFVECVREEMSEAQNGIWVNYAQVYDRFNVRCFSLNKGQKTTKEMKAMRSAACEQAVKGGQVKCGNKYDGKIMECGYTKLRSGLDVYLSFRSFAEKKENPAHAKNVDIFVECVHAGIAISKKGLWVEQSYVIVANQSYVFTKFYEKTFPMNKSQKKTKSMRCVLNTAWEQAIRKGIVICWKISSQGTIKFDLANMQSPRDWGECYFSLQSAVEKMGKPAENSKSIVEKIITEKTEMKQEHTHSLQATDAQTSQQTTSISSNQKVKSEDVDDTESHTNIEAAKQQSRMPFHGKSSARPSSKEPTDIVPPSSSLSHKEITNQIEIVLCHTQQHSNKNDQHLRMQKPVTMYPHLSSPISRRWGMEVVRLVDGGTDDDKGTGTLVVDSVLTESLAYEAGVRRGDVIVGVFGGPVVESKQLFRMLARTEYVE